LGKESKRKLKPAAQPLKLDFGCGPNPREGFEGVDVFAFDGKVKHVVDLRVAPWPWADGSVAEAHASHFIEHLTQMERVLFCNELYRVLTTDAKCSFAVPHWASCRAYGDPTHQWPPISEFWFLYLNEEWRMANAPHTDISTRQDGFNCHFLAVYGYALRPDVSTRAPEWQQFAMANYKEVCQDIIGELKKLPHLLKKETK
jgi:hypothetical protein